MQLFYHFGCLYMQFIMCIVPYVFILYTNINLLKDKQIESTAILIFNNNLNSLICINMRFE